MLRAETPLILHNFRQREWFATLVFERGKQEMNMGRHNDTSMKLDSFAILEETMLQCNRPRRWREI